ncbi:hypothetical protein DFA_09810 [Cavenderia fasciculata]|uniref:DUF4291 domain-containing protein n=1 Tax=Cavenderia fasciculata TaxID=261658 RepID=F4QAS2_CACFS|nr:uncharacterized protein DFA_09810 [Cavenderia fasciculata]EGG14990.1 hypothetical protein DFA_09810 [Cavenderia fasciculata]|eukprot:XP_004351710.1 hypothetical protein DFA_09810 [Cavenderia fasciculata]
MSSEFISKEFQIRAVYNKETIRVYQAYNNEIADYAVKHQTFTGCPHWSTERTTWIKPSFLWMMYRSGWAQKDKNQNRILAIDIHIKDFEYAIQNNYKSSTKQKYQIEGQELPPPSKEHSQPPVSKVDKSNYDIVVQWDPERSIKLGKLGSNIKSIQIGIKKRIAEQYSSNWITQITDITNQCLEIKQLLDNGHLDQAQSLLPIEKVYIPSFIK